VAPSVQLTVVMPCLNERETLASCIEKARVGIERAGVLGEILVADNCSRDNSVPIAEKLEARVVHVKKKVRQRAAGRNSSRIWKMDRYGRRVGSFRARR
jgi:glycosyltransferase involved in cell wall biosynthesis